MVDECDVGKADECRYNPGDNVRQPGCSFFPCLGWSLQTAETMIPASAGPQVAIKTNGASKSAPLFITAS